MMTKENKQRIRIFLAFSFGISWLTALVIYLTGGLADSPTFTIGNIPLSLALVLMATAYMFGPAIANVITRLLTKEGKTGLNLRPHFDHGRWLYYLAAWFLPGLLTLLGVGFFFLILPGYFDAELNILVDQLTLTGMEAVNPWLIIIIQTIQALIMAPVLNALPTFGEEFGWRGYLQPKLLPLGGRKAILLTGVIWGVWHWPIILMGYNFGSDYFGAPFLGPLAMVWFTVTVSALFGWVTIKADSVWPAVIGHGALNGIAAIGLLFLQNNPDALLGPTPVGLLGGIGFTLTAIVLFLHPAAFEPRIKSELNQS